jgi:hypothetical protein
MRLAGNVTLVGERRRAYVGLVERHEGKRIFRRQRYRWEDNIKPYFEERR